MMRPRGFIRLAAPLVGASIILWPRMVAAETLFDAIDLAYQSNPALRAQREQLRSTDEDYIQAKAGFGPQVNVNAQFEYQNARVQQFTPGSYQNLQAGTGSADLAAVQPIYTTGAISAQVRGAAANVLSARQTVRQTESQLLQNVITAYVDVRRDRETVRILQDEITALTQEFQEIKAKGAKGVLTRTDVAESEARLLSAQAQLNLAYGRLNVSNAEYLDTVGQNPGELAPEPVLPGLPATADQAFESAAHNNAQLLSAQEAERAAREKVTQAKAENGPNVSIKLDANVSPFAPYLQRQYDQSLSASVVYSQPLFTSGLNSSKVRKALDDDNHAQLDVEATRRGVVQLVAQAWDQLASSRSAEAIEERAINVEQVAVKGNRIEERVGLRLTIEVLDAEQELANARVNLVQTRHDEYVASAALLSAMGLLEARFLDPKSPEYRPQDQLKRLKNQYAPPWEGGVAIVDDVASPVTPAPRLSAADAGSQRPTSLPSLPEEATSAPR